MPKLSNQQAFFNHVKYSPNGTLAYIRSIHEIDQENFAERIADVEMAIVNLETNSINFLQEALLTSVDLAPVWSADSGQLFAWRDGLIGLNVSSQDSQTVIPAADFPSLKPYAINPQTDSIVYISGKNYDAEKPWDYNPEIVISTQQGQEQTKLLDTKDAHLMSKDNAGFLTDVGWLDEGTVWFAYSRTSTTRDLWAVQKDGSSITKVLDNVNQYSLNSVDLPITNSYTLY